MVRINQKKDGKNVDELNGVYVTHQAFIDSSNKFNPASYDRKDIFLLKAMLQTMNLWKKYLVKLHLIL